MQANSYICLFLPTTKSMIFGKLLEDEWEVGPSQPRTAFRERYGRSRRKAKNFFSTWG